MRTLKGPSIFLSQFIGNDAPFNSLNGLAEWAAGLGYRAVQIPTHLPHIFDLALAARSQQYCQDIQGMLADFGLEISELSTHLQGQWVAVHPAYEQAFAGFAPAELAGSATARQQWAVESLCLAAKASQRLGLTAHATFSGALAWPYFYPWPPRSERLIDEAFHELATRWLPILNTFDESGVDVCFELHPGEDLHDGVTFDKFLALTGHHPRCNILYDPSHMLLQHMDYLGFIDIYHSRIKAFHVKDAEFMTSPRHRFDAFLILQTVYIHHCLPLFVQHGSVPGLTLLGIEITQIAIYHGNALITPLRQIVDTGSGGMEVINGH